MGPSETAKSSYFKFLKLINLSGIHRGLYSNLRRKQEFYMALRLKIRSFDHYRGKAGTIRITPVLCTKQRQIPVSILYGPEVKKIPIFNAEISHSIPAVVTKSRTTATVSDC